MFQILYFGLDKRNLKLMKYLLVVYIEVTVEYYLTKVKKLSEIKVQYLKHLI